MNVFNEHPFKVLFDYGHNAHAVGALADLASRLDCSGRRIVVLAGPGDRRDEDLRAIAEAVAGRFDHYICRRDDDLRNRAPDEVPRIQSAALQAFGVPASAISVIPDEQEAIETALNMGQPGDLLLIFADALVRSWKQVIKFRPAGMAAPSVTADMARESGETVPAAGTGGIGGFISGGPPAPPFAGESAQTAAEGFRASTAPVRGIEIAKPFGTHTSHVSSTPAEPSLVFAGATMKDLPGVIRDERGVRLAPEAED